jgi:hypothetical protein
VSLIAPNASLLASTLGAVGIIATVAIAASRLMKPGRRRAFTPTMVAALVIFAITTLVPWLAILDLMIIAVVLAFRGRRAAT